MTDVQSTYMTINITVNVKLNDQLNTNQVVSLLIGQLSQDVIGCYTSAFKKSIVVDITSFDDSVKVLIG